MTCSYLIAFDDALDRSLLLRALDRHPDVSDWYAPMSHAVIVATDMLAQDISRYLQKHFPTRKFVVLDMKTDRAGWLSRAAWTMIHRGDED